MRANEVSLFGDDLVEFARQRERERLWASATLMICALGIVAVVVVLAVGAAVEALAEFHGGRHDCTASGTVELVDGGQVDMTGVGPACREMSQPGDYPDVPVEEF